MASSLNVIALVSGGKDSFFSILHCLANGHKVVALANLHPPVGDDEDMNSHMYQTVGHSIIPLYEEALEIPLHRQEIRGTAINQRRDYALQHDDETESLVPLLEKVKRAHPETNAVSTGAIFSNYQRTRVENVAVRLGLTPLSYLWQYPILPPYIQSSLLNDMRTVGQDARIIKVASYGLYDGFLWENVAHPRTVARMKKAIGPFSEGADGALLGEGGEFETLAIDGPSVLWKKRIDIEQDVVVRESSGTAYWKGKNAKLVLKEADNTALDHLRRVPLYDEEFASILTAGLQPKQTFQSKVQVNSLGSGLPTNQHSKNGSVSVFNNITGETVPKLTPGSIQHEFANIVCRLNQWLRLNDSKISSVSHCTLLLRDMDDFVSINDIYGKVFNFTNPPSRVTVAAGEWMPSPYSIMLSVLVNHREERIGLHVQSRSYWAPANIGPYSQAISTPLFEESERGSSSQQTFGYEMQIAGQIPLNPASMTLHIEDGFAGEALLSLQHLFRVGRSQSVRRWVAGVAMIAVSPDPSVTRERVLLAQAAWSEIHKTATQDEDEDGTDMDPWDRKNLTKAFNDSVLRCPLPDGSVISSVRPAVTSSVPPCFVVEVASLPRGASVEWSSIGLTSNSLLFEEHQTYSPSCDATVVAETSLSPRGAGGQESQPGLRYCTAEIVNNEPGVGDGRGGTWQCGTLYASPRLVRSSELSSVGWVPCKTVWGQGGREVDAVMVGRVVRED